MSLNPSRICAAGVLIAASTLALAAPAWAAEQPAPAPVADGLVVVRDAETGLLRAPTAEEAAALTATSKAGATTRTGAKGAATFQTKLHASGAVGVRLNDDTASYSVVVKRADGTLVAACLESRSEAEQAVQSGVLPAQQAAEK